MYVFTRKSVIEVRFAITGYSFSWPTSDLLDFYANKTEEYLQTKVHMPWWGITCCLQFRRNSHSKLCYLSVAMDSMGKSLQAYEKRREAFKFLNAAISKYTQVNFCCVMEKPIINVMWSSRKSTRGTQLRHDKRDTRHCWVAFITDKMVLSCGPKAQKNL